MGWHGGDDYLAKVTYEMMPGGSASLKYVVGHSKMRMPRGDAETKLAEDRLHTASDFLIDLD